MTTEMTLLVDDLRQVVAEARQINKKIEHSRAERGAEHALAGEQLTRALTELAATQEKIADLETRLNAPRAVDEATDTDAPLHAGRRAAEHYIRGTLTRDDLPHLAIATRADGEVIRRDEQRALSVDGSTGHYVVLPPAMSDQLLDLIRVESAMEQVCSVETIDSDTWEQVKVTGGALAGRVSERGVRGATSEPQFGKLAIPLYGYYAYPTLTQKQIYLSRFDIVSFLNTEVRYALQTLMEEDYLTGDGAGKPVGLLSAPGISEVHSGHASTLPSADPLLKMIYSLDQRFLPNARFMMRRATELSLMLLKDGQNRYIWQPSMAGSAPNTVFGYRSCELQSRRPAGGERRRDAGQPAGGRRWAGAYRGRRANRGGALGGPRIPDRSARGVVGLPGVKSRTIGYRHRRQRHDKTPPV